MSRTWLQINLLKLPLDSQPGTTLQTPLQDPPGNQGEEEEGEEAEGEENPQTIHQRDLPTPLHHPPGNQGEEEEGEEELEDQEDREDQEEEEEAEEDLHPDHREDHIYLHNILRHRHQAEDHQCSINLGLISKEEIPPNRCCMISVRKSPNGMDPWKDANFGFYNMRYKKRS